MPRSSSAPPSCRRGGARAPGGGGAAPERSSPMGSSGLRRPRSPGPEHAMSLRALARRACGFLTGLPRVRGGRAAARGTAPVLIPPRARRRTRAGRRGTACTYALELRPAPRLARRGFRLLPLQEVVAPWPRARSRRAPAPSFRRRWGQRRAALPALERRWPGDRLRYRAHGQREGASVRRGVPAPRTAARGVAPHVAVRLGRTRRRAQAHARR